MSLSSAYFNTSNVTIQQTKVYVLFITYKDFNTSNVTIQRSINISIQLVLANFNTSNVTIQPKPP